MGAGHPECPARLDAINDWLLASGLDAGLQRHDARPASLTDLTLAHTQAYVAELSDQLQRCEQQGEHVALDPDTAANPHTRRAALMSWRRRAGDGPGAGRPRPERLLRRAPAGPPRHAGPGHGLCFFNNVAIAARHALDVMGLKRVAIADFDVHHGNGTEDIIAATSAC